VSGNPERARLADASRTAAANGGVTVLVSYRFSTVWIADRFVVMDGAKVVEAGAHEELSAKGGPNSELYAIRRGPDNVHTHERDGYLPTNTTTYRELEGTRGRLRTGTEFAPDHWLRANLDLVKACPRQTQLES
jgi:hypothetical protein